MEPEGFLNGAEDVVKGIKWRHGYDAVENEEVGRACATVNTEPTRTQQQFAMDADINVLIRRFGVDKVSAHYVDPSAYGDFTEAPDLRGALEILRAAEDSFMQLPAKVRARFQNSAAELWDFLQEPENRDEAIALGIVEKPRPAASQAEVAPPGETPVTPAPAPEPEGKAK